MTISRCFNDRACYGEHDGRGAWTEPPLCEACLSRASRDVAALVYDYAGLEQLLVVGNARRDSMVTETRELPLPYNVHADALQRGIWHALTTWEEVLREYLNANLPERSLRVRPGYAVQRAARYLGQRMAILSRLEPVAVYPVGSTTPEDQSGLDAVDTLVTLHRRATAMLGLTKRVEILPGGCPSCQCETVSREYGSETVTCYACGRSETWDDYLNRMSMAT